MCGWRPARPIKKIIVKPFAGDGNGPAATAAPRHNLPMTTVAARNQKTYAAFSLFLFAIILVRFLFVLDRYPPANPIDETLFSQPAINYLDGHGFRFALSPDAPHANELWFYHAPFFPRFQVLTFSTLGISQFSSRLPQYLASSLAVLLLSLVLIRSNLPIAGIVLPVAWLGDRSSIEVVLGRPEGVALLALAAAFVAVARRDRWGLPLAASASGFFTLLASGLHPTNCVFAAGAFLILAADAGLSRLPRLILFFALGAALPIACILWCAAPDFRAALAQLSWCAHLGYKKHGLGRLLNGFAGYYWSRYWVWAVGAVTVALVLDSLVRRRQTANQVSNTAVWFSLCGLLTFAVSVIMLPPYLVYWSVWPVIALATRIESGSRAGSSRRLYMALACVFVLAWIPSFAWNAVRTREAYRFHSALDPAPVRATLMSAIPRDAHLMVSGDLFMTGRHVTRDVGTIAPYSRSSDWPCDAWLALTDGAAQRWSAGEMPKRAIYVPAQSFFPNSPFTRKMTIFTPCR